MARQKSNVFVSDHARTQAERRSLELNVVIEVARAPEQRVALRVDREIRQSRVTIDGKLYLVRVIVDLLADRQEIVTVYRTSKVEKYWSR